MNLDIDNIQANGRKYFVECYVECDHEEDGDNCSLGDLEVMIAIYTDEDGEHRIENDDDNLEALTGVLRSKHRKTLCEMYAAAMQGE